MLVVTDDAVVPPRKPVALVLGTCTGRVFAVIDSDFIQNAGYDAYDNKKFALQITKWLLWSR